MMSQRNNGRGAATLFRAVLFVLTIMLSAAVAFATPSAQRIPRERVPPAVLERYAKEHPRLKAVGYVADYRRGKPVVIVRAVREGGLRCEYTYSESGTAVESEEQIAAADVPKNIRAAIEKKYAGQAAITRAMVVREAGEREREYKLHVRGDGIEDDLRVDNKGRISTDTEDD